MIHSHSQEKNADPQWRTKVAIKGLEVALKGYETEYGKHLPDRLEFEEDQEYLVDGAIIKVLLALDVALNPRKIRFFDPPQTATGRDGVWTDQSGALQLRDSWGGTYRIRFDADNDGLISLPGLTAPVTAPIAIYSPGPDGDLKTWADNITSWNQSVAKQLSPP